MSLSSGVDVPEPGGGGGAKANFAEKLIRIIVAITIFLMHNCLLKTYLK